MSESDAKRAALRERGIALALAAAAALIGVTCASRGTLEQKPATSLASVTASTSGVDRAARRAPSSIHLPPAVDTSARALDQEPVMTDPTRLVFPRFYQELAELAERTRSTPVRILWLGDSHTAADYLTGTVRARLQARFGVGGPGFVRVGVKPYRHTQVRVGCDGAWRVEPPQPSRRTPFDDAIFGFCGMRAVASGASSRASFELFTGSAHGRLHWEVWYSLVEGGSFRASVGGATEVVSTSTPRGDSEGSGFASLTLDGALADPLELVALSGAPRFYGLSVEGSEPGLVLDAVGIDGARVATALAWSGPSFEAALRTRAPSLVVLAFGTNEAFDADRLEKYRAQYRELLGRVRAAGSTADCLLLGPPDANALGGGSEPRVAEIDALQRAIAGELGCGFVSQLEIMGGPGAYSHWANESPSLALNDRLHLTKKGYEAIANAISDRLLAAYDVARGHAAP